MKRQKSFCRLSKHKFWLIVSFAKPPWRVLFRPPFLTVTMSEQKCRIPLVTSFSMSAILITSCQEALCQSVMLPEIGFLPQDPCHNVLPPISLTVSHFYISKHLALFVNSLHVILDARVNENKFSSSFSKTLLKSQKVFTVIRRSMIFYN